jgi:hypothetical protein
MFESPMKPIWWLPTFGFFLFLAIEGWMFAPPDWQLPGPDRLFADPGVGRHLRTAESILETGRVPRTDPLSYTKAGAPWIDFEWAFETTIGELYRAGGLALVCAFCFAIFASTILGIYRTLLQSGVSFAATMIYTLVALLTLQIHFLARPVLFTYLFLALMVEVWHRRSQPSLRDWILLPLVFVAWANLHAGWLAALAFLAIALTGRAIDRLTHRVTGDDAPLIPWLVLTLLCLLATWFNPWGWKLHYAVIFLATSLQSAKLWDEYLPPNFSTPTMSAIAVLFIVAVVFLARLSKRAPPWRWEIVLPLLFFLYEGLKAQRHVLLLVEIAAVPVARDLEAVLYGTAWPFLRERLREFQARQRLAAGDAWLALVAALVLAALFVRTPAARDIRVGANISPRLVAFLRDHPDRFQRPLNTTWNAGPLLWAMRPDFRVSIDDRGDFYGDAYVYNFIDTTNGSAGWDEKLKKGNFDSLLLDPYLPINQLLKYQPEWKQVWRDDHIVVYWKNDN